MPPTMVSFFNFLRQKFTFHVSQVGLRLAKQLRMTLNFRSSCPHLSSTGTINLHHWAQFVPWRDGTQGSVHVRRALDQPSHIPSP